MFVLHLSCDAFAVQNEQIGSSKLSKCTIKKFQRERKYWNVAQWRIHKLLPMKSMHTLIKV